MLAPVTRGEVPVTTALDSESAAVAVTNTSVVPFGNSTLSPASTATPLRVITPRSVLEDSAALTTFSVYSRVVVRFAAVTVITTSLSPVSS